MRVLAIGAALVLAVLAAGCGSARPLALQAPTRVKLASAETGTQVVCRNARMSSTGSVPAPGKHIIFVANYSGYAPDLSLARESDGSLVVSCN